jgi:hypothetical protein
MCKFFANRAFLQQTLKLLFLYTSQILCRFLYFFSREMDKHTPSIHQMVDTHKLLMSGIQDLPYQHQVVSSHHPMLDDLLNFLFRMVWTWNEHLKKIMKNFSLVLTNGMSCILCSLISWIPGMCWNLGTIFFSFILCFFISFFVYTGYT